MIESHNMRLIFIFVIGITQIFTLPQGYEFVSPLSFEETHVDEASINGSPLEVNNIEEIHADAVMEEQNIPSLSNGIWSSPVEVDDMSSLHADAVMEAKKRKNKDPSGKRIFESPVELDDLDNLHADAVMEAKKSDDTVMDAKKKESPGKKWFEAIDAKTLDKVITEMNEMNRWFAKVVKYWDDFTSGGTGEEVLKETGMGIEEPDAVDAGKNEDETTPEEEGYEGMSKDGDDGITEDGVSGEEYPIEGDVDEEAPPDEGVGDEAPADEDVDEELPAEEDIGEEEEPLGPLDDTLAEGEEELPAEDGDLPEADGAAGGEDEAPTEEELPEEADEEEATESSRRRRMRRRRRM